MTVLQITPDYHAATVQVRTTDATTIQTELDAVA